MANIISELAGSCGISPEMAQQGLGAILALIKKNLPPEISARINAAVPETDQLIAKADAAKEASSGGMLGTISEMAGKLFGGNAEGLTQLSKLGFSPDQLQAFLPKVMEFLQSKLPPEVMQQISSLLPTPEVAAR